MSTRENIPFKTGDIVIQIALILIFGTLSKNLEGFFLMWIVTVGWQLVSFIAHLFVKKDQKKRPLRILWITTLIWSTTVSTFFIATFILSFFAMFLEMFFLPVLGVFYFIISLAEIRMMKKENDQSQSIHAIL